MKSKHFVAENRRLSIGTYLLKHINIHYFEWTYEEWKGEKNKKKEIIV